MEHPHEFTDTDERTMEVWLEMQRNMSPAAKLDAVLDSSAMLLEFYAAGVRLQYPQAGEREVLVRTAARHLPRELVIAAYGWDPEGDADPT